MKFFRRDLVQQPYVEIQFSEAIAFDLSQFQKNHSSLRGLPNVLVSGVIRYDLQHDHAIVDYKVSGRMIVACSITNEDVDYEFETETNEIYSFVQVKEDEDMIEVKEDFIDLSLSVFQTILFEVPLRIVKPGLTEYPKGDGWEVLTEEAYQGQEKPIDPRLAKLREFKSKE